MDVKQKAEDHVRKICQLEVPVALPLPIEYDGIHFFFGPKGEIVADTVDDFDGGELFRIRGWGRIQHLKEEGKTADQLQDECAHWFAEAINAYASPRLDYWMRGIESSGLDYELSSVDLSVIRMFLSVGSKGLEFDKKTGQPATEGDYKAYCEIVGI